MLGVEEAAGDEALRAAYLRGLREFPPDREPERFQELREAYDLLRDPRNRIARLFSEAESTLAVAEWVRSQPESRKYIGPGPWLDALKDTRKK